MVCTARPSFVQRLEVNGHIGRQFEMGRAVRLDGHRAENAAAKGLVADADVGIVGDAGGFGKDLHDAQGFDGGAFRPGQRGVVDVHDGCGGGYGVVARRSVGPGLRSLDGNHRWPRAGLERDRIETRHLGIRVEVNAVAEAVEEVQAVVFPSGSYTTR